MNRRSKEFLVVLNRNHTDWQMVSEVSNIDKCDLIKLESCGYIELNKDTGRYHFYDGGEHGCMFGYNDENENYLLWHVKLTEHGLETIRKLLTSPITLMYIEQPATFVALILSLILAILSLLNFIANR